jgi:hypothetical protein
MSMPNTCLSHSKLRTVVVAFNPSDRRFVDSAGRNEGAVPCDERDGYAASPSPNRSYSGVEF